MVSSIEVRSVGLCHATHFFFKFASNWMKGRGGYCTLIHYCTRTTSLGFGTSSQFGFGVMEYRALIDSHWQMAARWS